MLNPFHFYSFLSNCSEVQNFSAKILHTHIEGNWLEDLSKQILNLFALNLSHLKHGALQICDSGLQQCCYSAWGPGAKGDLGTLKVLAEHPLNSSDQGQSIRSGHLKHVSSFRGAPNDILIWKITNNLTPTTSPATSQGMCSVVDLREPLINGSFKVPWWGEALTVEIIFDAFKGTHFINALHL